MLTIQTMNHSFLFHSFHCRGHKKMLNRLLVQRLPVQYVAYPVNPISCTCIIFDYLIVFSEWREIKGQFCSLCSL